MSPSRSLLIGAALAVTALAAPDGASAQSRDRCVPGSIGPGGCDSIRPQDQPPDLPDFARERLPSDVPLDTERGALLDLRGATPGERERLLELRELERVRRRGDSVLPLPRATVPGRNPEALQDFQAPYAFD